MSVLYKRVKVSMFITIALGGLSLLGLLVMNTAFSFFSDSIVNYAKFANSILLGMLNKDGFTYPTDIFANVSFIIGVLTCAFGLVWMILTCCKNKLSGIAYFFGCILLSFVASYAAFLFARVDYKGLSFEYFWYALNYPAQYSGELTMLIIFALFTLLTLVSMIILGIFHISYAFNSARKTVSKASIDKHEEKVETQTEKAVILVKTAESKTLNEETKKTAEEKAKAEALEKAKKEATEKAKAEAAKKAKKEAEEKAKAEALEKVKKEAAEKAKADTAKKTPVVKEKKLTEEKEVKADKDVKGSTESKAKQNEEKTISKEQTEVKPSGKVYHISQHPTTNKWQVKLAKGEKALKLFDTQAEAIAFAKEISKNQGGSIRVHSMAGKIRKA